MAGFFHTLVVFGASASLVGCGAKVTSESGEGSGGPHGGQSGGAGGPASAPGEGGAASQGGAPNLVGGAGFTGAGGRGSGGAPAGSTGAGGIVGAAGAASSGGSAGEGGSPTLDPRTVAQWSCDGLWSGCQQVVSDGGTESFYALSGPCPVDASRPRSEADCAPEELFECARVFFGERRIAVDCLCVAPPVGGSCDTCTRRGSGRQIPRDITCTPRAKLCGCITGILLVQ